MTSYYDYCDLGYLASIRRYTAANKVVNHPTLFRAPNQENPFEFRPHICHGKSCDILLHSMKTAWSKLQPFRQNTVLNTIVRLKTSVGYSPIFLSMLQSCCCCLKAVNYDRHRPSVHGNGLMPNSDYNNNRTYSAEYFCSNILINSISVHTLCAVYHAYLTWYPHHQTDAARRSLVPHLERQVVCYR